MIDADDGARSCLLHAVTTKRTPCSSPLVYERLLTVRCRTPHRRTFRKLKWKMFPPDKIDLHHVVSNGENEREFRCCCMTAPTRRAGGIAAVLWWCVRSGVSFEAYSGEKEKRECNNHVPKGTSLRSSSYASIIFTCCPKRNYNTAVWIESDVQSWRGSPSCRISA